MIYNQKYSFVIRDSKDNYYKFNLNNNYLYIDEYVNGTKKVSTHLDESIIDYSVDIDRTDTIHILYMCTDGNLKYKLYSSSNRTVISKINTNFYKIKFLTLKITFPNIHIFYMTCNRVNSNQWLIYHNFWNGKKWTSSTVCQCSANKFIYPYMIDSDVNNIYLFYSKNCNDLYAVKKFNLSFERWLTLDNNIYIYPSHNTTFFINDNNKAIICYNASVNKSIQILVKYKDLNKNSSTWSKPIMVSNGSENAIHPCIFCKNNFTYIMWSSGDKLTYKKSTNICDWSNKNLINVNVATNNLINAIFISNHPQDLKYKNTFTIFSLKDIPIPIFNIVNHTHYMDNNSNKICNNIFNNNQNFKTSIPSNTPNSSLNLNANNTNVIKLKDNYIKQLSAIIVEKDSILSNLQLQLQNTRSQLNTLENSISQHSEITKDLKLKNIHLLDELKYFKETIKKYNELKSDLESKNNHLLSELKNSKTNIEVLTAEKNSIISELNKKITELTLTIDTKDSSISELSTKLNSASSNTEIENDKDAKILELEKQLKYYTNRGFWKIFK